MTNQVALCTAEKSKHPSAVVKASRLQGTVSPRLRISWEASQLISVSIFAYQDICPGSASGDNKVAPGVRHTLDLVL